MRKLASIQRVKEVLPVITASGDEATSLVLVRFHGVGWQCVGKRGEFEPGDLAVYIEVSTVLPEHPIFEFMRPRKFKVKTVKFVGTTLSQGLVFPISILKEFLPPGDEFWSVGEGDDVSAMIGVTRYDAEAQDNKTGGEVLGVFPEHIVPKTDELRLQSYPFLLEAMKQRGGDVAATLKYDGTSATFFWEDGALHACSRNFDQKPGNGSVYWKVAEKYGLERILRQHPQLVLQGEITAPGIQKNRLGQNGPHLNIFNVWNRRENTFLNVWEVQSFCYNNYLDVVQIVKTWADGSFQLETLESLLELAKGFYHGTKNPREGIVVRPLHQVIFEPRIGTQLSFKVINNDYLLNGGE